MENLKIKVNRKTTKEVVKLLKKLGYHAHCKASEYIANGATWLIAERDQYGSGYDYVIEYSLTDGVYTDSNHKEITLLELRALVSLHKNPINMDKVLSEVRSDALGLFEGKEYLNKETHEFVRSSSELNDMWIEIPEGAVRARFYPADPDTGIEFENQFAQWWHTDELEWIYYMDQASYNHSRIVWQRHTQPEELPFVDDEPNQTTINAMNEADTLFVDAVNHPSHYTSDPSGIECIEITRHRNFNIGNAIKYLWRNGLKDSDAQIQDLEKSIWYIQDEIKRLSKQ